MASEKDDLRVPLGELPLKFKAAETGHLHVEHQTGWAIMTRAREIIPG